MGCERPRSTYLDIFKYVKRRYIQKIDCRKEAVAIVQVHVCITCIYTSKCATCVFKNMLTVRLMHGKRIESSNARLA